VIKPLPVVATRDQLGIAQLVARVLVAVAVYLLAALVEDRPSFVAKDF
jgi:hypothetical protein